MTNLGLSHDDGYPMGVKLGSASPAHHLQAGAAIVLLVALVAPLIAPTSRAFDDYQPGRQIHSYCKCGSRAQNLHVSVTLRRLGRPLHSRVASCCTAWSLQEVCMFALEG